MSKYKRENQSKVKSIYVENDILDILAQVDPNRSKAVAILAKYWQASMQRIQDMTTEEYEATLFKETTEDGNQNS